MSFVISDWWVQEAAKNLQREIDREVINYWKFPQYDIWVCDIKWGKSVELHSKEARDYVHQVTGIRYRTINLPNEDSLLTALLLKFKQ